jgi:hypothetical protein
MNIRSKEIIIGSAAVIIAAIITGIFGLFEGWYTSKGVNRISQEERTQTINRKSEIKNEKVIHTEKQNAHNKTKIQIGDTVLSMWKEQGELYPGTVRETKEGKYRIFYYFFEEEWVKAKYIYLTITPKESEINIDTKVFVQSNSCQNKWIPSTIKAIRDNKYYVTYNNDTHEWVAIKRIILQ